MRIEQPTSRKRGIPPFKKPETHSELLRRFFIETPMYKPVKVTGDDDYAELRSALIMKKAEFSLYNPEDKIDTTAKIEFVDEIDALHDGGFTGILMKCKRTEREFFLVVYYDRLTGQMSKVGQWPSMVDIHNRKDNEFIEVLPEDKFKEFGKATELHQSGHGAGALIYLRRIMEHLVYSEYEQNRDFLLITEDVWKKAWKLRDKITLLKDHLPAFLVSNNTQLYESLSEGVHLLSEDKCIEYFEPLKKAIEVILRQKVAKEITRKNEADIELLLHQTHGTIKPPKKV